MGAEEDPRSSTIVDDRRSQPPTHPPRSMRRAKWRRSSCNTRSDGGSDPALSLALALSVFLLHALPLHNQHHLHCRRFSRRFLSLSLSHPHFTYFPAVRVAYPFLRTRASTRVPALRFCQTVCLSVCVPVSLSLLLCACECVRVRFPFIVGLCMHALLVLGSTAVPRKGESAPVSWRLGGGWSGGNWEQVGTTRAWWGRSRRRGGGAEAYRQWQRQRSPRMGWEAMSS